MHVLLAVALGFDQRPDDSQHHGDGDDEHGGCLSDTQLAVYGGQGAPGLLLRSVAHDVLVVVHMQVSNVTDLGEVPLQFAVTGPAVEGHLEVGGGGLELQEGLEPDVLQLVPPETQQGQTAQRGQSMGLDQGDVVVAEQQNLQAVLPAQQPVSQRVQPVPLQAQDAQVGQAAESPHIDGPDAIITEVQFPEVF